MRLAAVLQAPDENEASFSSQAAKAMQRRGSERRALTLSASTSTPSAGETQVLIRDISPGGLLIEAATTALSADDWIEISLPERGVVRARVAWNSGHLFGCEFTEPVSWEAVSAALLKAEPQNAENNLAAAADGEDLSPRSRSRLGPELNFSTALCLLLALWAVVGAAAYFLTR